MTTPTADHLLDRVAEQTEQIADHDAKSAALRAERLETFRALRALTPPVPFTAIAARADMSDVGVKNVLRRAEP